MAKLNPSSLDLTRCPHCNVDSPTLEQKANAETIDFENRYKRRWAFYACKRCGGIVTASAREWDQPIEEIFPSGSVVDATIPERAHAFLSQAINSRSAPSGAVMLAASAVDAMLKAKNLKTGSLYSRIDQAKEGHLITAEMAQWAHDVRLDANDQRHADEEAPLPSEQDAKRAIDFALALAQFMFVLPARVQRGLADTKKT